ncbi:MAG: hypothetical protein HRU20_29475 [Pseudomonadales bacterium]|nr:hypothetical protein [Pseudomonadales bacterium]
MKQYHEDEFGHFNLGNMAIPADLSNRHYQAMQTEAAAGRAEILRYNGPTISELASEKIHTLNAACSAVITGGFISTALGANHRYSSTLDDQVNIAGNVQDAQLGEDNVHGCYDTSNVKDYRLHTPKQMIQVGRDLKVHKLAALQKANALKVEVATAVDAKDSPALSAINWT